MLSFNELVKLVKNKKIYMMIGNGSKNQFRDMRKLKGILTKILKTIPQKAVFIYFGDPVDKKRPNVGLLFKIIKEKRPDLFIYMIHIIEAKAWGVPNFVNNVYWHNDYTSLCKWGGIYKGKPCSNTKKWLSLHKRVNITKVFIFGGGKITFQEYKLLKARNILYEYFPVERKYFKDKRVTNKNTLSERIGITYKKIK